MNDLKIFSNTEFGELGIMMIDGKEYFPATQCAKILGYTNPRKAVIDHCKEEGVTKRDVPTSGGVQQIKYINEGNLYRLIVSSKLSAAEKFERWVFDEVLPSIRQTGGYGSVDINELVAKTATAVAGEIVKQLMPIITRGSIPEEPEMIWETRPRKKRKSYGVISSLAPELREAVDNMLYNNCSYQDVVNFLKANSIGVSLAAVCRYYNHYIV